MKPEIHQIEITDIPDYNADNDLMKKTVSLDGKGWCHSLKKFIKLLNIFFQIRSTYKLSHVNDK